MDNAYNAKKNVLVRALRKEEHVWDLKFVVVLKVEQKILLFSSEEHKY
jgi:hypothetical protein